MSAPGARSPLAGPAVAMVAVVAVAKAEVVPTQQGTQQGNDHRLSNDVLRRRVVRQQQPPGHPCGLGISCNACKGTALADAEASVRTVDLSLEKAC